ncbi:MIT (microtubule interacting and transport) domain [Nesidiocoris tenuis]|uniref:Serine/threonine-protein kinase ULK3 n=1 Tax=Nesidiocoris tenuis TaxID=355587 RepID=A0ABN7AV97_9HEMI|nr:MIT (microtubule interacting and transport) domain [Nesidiocoris tenuis]
MPLSINEKQPQVEGYRILERIGSGSYSVVYKARHVDSGEEVAVKCILKCNLSPTGRDNIINEIQIMKMLMDPHILSMIDFQYDEWYIYLILEFCSGGDLSSFIKSRRKLSERTCRKFMQQLALGLKFLRSKNITHFDLKPQNLLLVTTPSLSLKIGDFGLSGFLSEEAHVNVLKGSPLYMAPEILLGKEVDPKADLWSVGVIFYECLFGEAPLAHSRTHQLVRILKSDQHINIPPGLSDECRDLLSRLLVIQPKDRISFDSFFSHPFLDLEHYPTDESYQKAVASARQAVKLDYEKNYLAAFNKYSESLGYLVPFLHTHLNPEKEKFVQSKVHEYLTRAEQLKCVLYKAQHPVPRVQNSKEPEKYQSIATESSIHSSLAPTMKHMALVGQDSAISEELAEQIDDQILTEAEIQTLKSLCSSTPKMEGAIDIGLTAQMYLYEGAYALALEHFGLCFKAILHLIENEPAGKRKALLTRMIAEWQKEAASAEALLAAKEEANLPSSLDRTESCVLQ